MEMTLFEIGVNILEIFITVMFLTLYFGCKYKGIKKAGGFVIGWAAITASQSRILCKLFTKPPR